MTADGRPQTADHGTSWQVGMGKWGWVGMRQSRVPNLWWVRSCALLVVYYYYYMLCSDGWMGVVPNIKYPLLCLLVNSSSRCSSSNKWQYHLQLSSPEQTHAYKFEITKTKLTFFDSYFVFFPNYMDNVWNIYSLAQQPLLIGFGEHKLK